MGLRSLICLLPAETSDHGRTEDDWMNQEMEQPGTSYGGTSSSGAATPNSFVYRKNGKGRDRERENKVNCSNGSAQLLACFRGGAINLIVHPPCELACQRKAASTVQPVNSLPRTTFLDRAEDHDSGDDPTSPVVTCIGQVRKEKSNKIPPRTPTTATAAEASQLRSLKSKPQNRVEESSTGASSSPRPSKWKQILGARGTVNPSQQHQQQQQQQTQGEAPEAPEFYIDLNRFGCGASSTTTQTTPTFGNFHNKFGRPDALAQTLTTSDGESARDGSHGIGASRGGGAVLRAPGAANEGVQLWKRRSGVCRPMSLDLQRRVVQIK